MDLLYVILPYLVGFGTFVAGLFTGKRKRRNDLLHELQKSIDVLAAKNTVLIKQIIEMNDEIIDLRKENGLLKKTVEAMSSKIEQLKKER